MRNYPHFVLLVAFPDLSGFNLNYSSQLCIRTLWIHHFHIDHCFQFLSGFTVVPREIEDKGYAKTFGVNKVHYGLCESDEFIAENPVVQTLDSAIHRINHHQR